MHYLVIDRRFGVPIFVFLESDPNKADGRPYPRGRWVNLKTAGTRTVTATDTVTSSITGTSANITVIAAAASRLVVTAPTSDTAGNAISVDRFEIY